MGKKQNNNKQTSWLLYIVIVIAVVFFAIGIKKYNELSSSASSNSPKSLGSRMNEFAQNTGINMEEFDQCYSSKETAGKVAEDVKEAERLGITGTPTSILINRETNEGYLLAGAYPVDFLKAYINNLLNNEEIPEKFKNPRVGAKQKFEISTISNQDWTKGSPEAKIALIEFSDYECPFCKTFHPYAEQLVKDMNEQVVWVYRHYPMDTLHRNARILAIASECVGKIGGNEAFWSFTDQVYLNQ